MADDNRPERSMTEDPEEVARFSAWADEWWDPKGKFKPLHKFHSARMEIIVDSITTACGLDPLAPNPLSGLTILDIGCGGGLIAEPLTKLGADVMGIDVAEANIKAARIHAEASGLTIDYRAVPAEALIEEGKGFDIVLALEVVEHVADRALFARQCYHLLRPGGYMLFSTINRTPKALLLAIFGAEYILRWLPRGTHHYEKLVRPEELTSDLEALGGKVDPPRGLSYNLFTDRWSPSDDCGVNYFLGARHP